MGTIDSGSHVFKDCTLYLADNGMAKSGQKWLKVAKSGPKWLSLKFFRLLFLVFIEND
jgi:hypothetical protein